MDNLSNPRFISLRLLLCLQHPFTEVPRLESDYINRIWDSWPQVQVGGRCRVALGILPYNCIQVIIKIEVES